MENDNRGPTLIAVTWTFTALAIITVLFKLFTRVHILHGVGLDDFFIFFSLALIVICTSLFSYDVHLGMGRHAATLPLEQLSLTVKINFIANPFGIMAYSFPNISVAILLERLLVPNSVRTIALYLLVVSQCVIAAISCVLLFVQCSPTEHLWNPAVSAACFRPGVVPAYSYFVGSFTAFTDIVLAIVPIAAFWKLQLNKKTKIGLCILMGCTLFAAICAIVKTTKLNELADLQDFTYDTVDLIIWAIVEANVIIIAACMPTLRPFFHAAFKQKSVSEGRSFFHWPSIFYSGSASSKRLAKSKSSSKSQLSGSAAPHLDVELGHPRTAQKLSSDSSHAILRTTDLSAMWDDHQRI